MSFRFAVGLLVTASLTFATGPGARLSGQGSDPRAEVDAQLTALRFTTAEIASLHTGKVISRAESSSDAGELVTQAAIMVRKPHAAVLSYYGQMIAYVDGQVTIAFGRFSTPATLTDVSGLAFDRSEVSGLKACRPGSCDIRLGGAGLKTLQSSIDWNAADAEARVNTYARKAAVDYVNAYRQRGDEALVTYNDRDDAVSLKSAWSGIVSNSSGLTAMLPELGRYLTRYPSDPLPGSRDVFYWIKENYGLKPVISIVHGVIYTTPGRTDRTIVAQKYIYASHYYDASLAVASIVSGMEAGLPTTYIVYGNRSRGDMLKGGFGGIQRTAARSQAKKAAESTLATIKQVLEAQPAN
jgi:hypothetical protein